MERRWKRLAEPKRGRSLGEPDSLRGATPGEIDALALQSGWRGVPTRGQDGMRWQDPTTRGADQVRHHSGNPNDPDPVKRGPYARLTRAAVRHPRPIPLAGNPFLE
jgi:hypothetical protein